MTSALKKTLYAAEQKRAEVARARRRWMREKVVLCFIDFKVNFSNHELTRILAELKDEIRSAYTEFTGKPQEEYWVVAHHVVR